MRIYKPTFKDRQGVTQESAKFYAELRTADGRVLRLPGFASERQTAKLGDRVQDLINCRASGETLPQDTAKWIETLPRQTTKVLARWGLLQGHTLAAGKPLSEHITDWRADLLARGNTEQHADLSARRVESVAKACGFKFYGDISAAKLQSELANRRKDTPDNKGKLIRGLSIQSTNFYLSCCKSFCRWMMHERRATSSPIEYLDGQNVATDKRHTRRMLNQSDFAKLLTAAQAGAERYGMSGAERALIYELAATTGLRASELASLTAISLSLGESPSVTIAAKSAKNRKAASLPLRADMAVKLAAFTATKLPTAAVFARLDKFNAARIVRIDLKAAGIPYTDESGNVFDFHALRHQFISNLAAAGVHPKTAQELARHSDIKLTMSRYTHIFRGELDKAVDLLPDYGAEQARQSAEAVKTGTNDLPVTAVALPGESNESVLARRWALLGTETRRPVAPGGVNAESGTSVSNPLSMRESCDNQGDLLKADGESRTRNLRFTKPLHEITKPLINQPELHGAESVLARRWALSAQKDARLAELIDRWDSLPEALRQGIFAMVKAVNP